MIGIILAGGQSLRFGGSPKGLQSLAGLPLVGHVHASLSLVCTEVFIECVPGSGYEGWGVPCIHASAEHAGKGPLAGLLAGLEAANGEMVAFAPCDMPLLAPPVFELLKKVPGGAYAVSPRGVEPLVCVLPASVQLFIQEVLAQPIISRVVEVFERAGVRSVTFEEEWPFVNVNTPEELARLAEHF